MQTTANIIVKEKTEKWRRQRGWKKSQANMYIIASSKNNNNMINMETTMENFLHNLWNHLT